MASAPDFWNAIIRSHADAATIAERVSKAVTHQRHCNDCDYITDRDDITICPDPRCRGMVA